MHACMCGILACTRMHAVALSRFIVWIHIHKVGEINFAGRTYLRRLRTQKGIFLALRSRNALHRWPSLLHEEAGFSNSASRDWEAPNGKCAKQRKYS